MKTQMLRVWVLGVALTSLLLGTGCQEGQARAEVPDLDKLVPELAPVNSSADLPKADPPVAPLDVAAADLEKTPASTNIAMPKLVANPVIPENLKVSPALEEVLKLAQAGVSEEVMLAYITNSANFFNVSSDAIVYLNDLGVSNNVITALIQHDSTPEMLARRQTEDAVKPLPPGVALNTPATNIYPPAVSQTVPAPLPDTAAAPPPSTDAEVTTVSAPAEPVNVSYFYSSLAPYGTWVDVDGYGLCWQPTVVAANAGWRPYSDRGRWIWSNHGWYWYSDYSWGWAPFHYGRWCDYPRIGWIWVPDTHWGPSWVSWRYSSSYCGWAPLPPSCYYRPGFGFSYYGASYGFSFGFDFGLSYHHYNYVPYNRFCDRSPGLHVVRGDRARGIHRETTVVNNYVVGDNNTIINNGAGRDRIASANRGRVPTATVSEAPARTGTRREQLVNNGSSLAIVRPSLPGAPERSHVAVPPRSGITRVSASSRETVAPNTSRGDAGGNAAPSASLTEPSRSTTPGVTRMSPAFADRLERTTAAVRGGNTDTTTPSAEPRGSVSVNNQSRAPILNSARNPVTPSTVRSSEARPRNERTEAPAQLANNNTPPPTTTAPSRPSVSRPNVSTPAPSLNRPSLPAAVNRSAAPNSAARVEQFRGSVDSRVNSRPAAPSVSSSVTRSAPAVSAPAPARPSFSGPSRPEPSRAAPAVSRPAPSFAAPARPAPAASAPVRSAPSVSAPVRSAPPAAAPSFSAPARSTPSFSAPAARSSPSFSAPSRSSGGGGGGGFRGGRGRD